ncbi:hypothetical protein GAS19_07770 [Burkholderia glumae]|uniref:hypothetical protein n=1 Tax=Burkholderia glumae TaxID=337 RepID=UPI001295275A|nr:hypothetical protein [Burkholderia glumae]QGA37556.1 hypothetical protein GAS19_07770 [Burkholderia glumae]
MDMKEQRRLNLLAYRDAHCEGSTAQLARAIERAPTYVTRMLYPAEKDGSRRIGEDLAREIELKLGKPVGWLDRPPGGANAAAPAPRRARKRSVDEELTQILSMMSPKERTQLLGAAKLIVSMRSADDDAPLQSPGG